MMRRRMILVGGLAAFSACALAGAAFVDPAPRLVWNATQSAPEGLYVIARRAPGIGEYALLDPPPPVRSFIDARAYLPPGAPLIKRVAALSGAEICRRGARIFIDGAVVAYALSTDTKGRAMPEWSGCFVLAGDEIFLLNDHEYSLDGRYFGAVRNSAVIGVATPLWVRAAKPALPAERKDAS